MPELMPLYSKTGEVLEPVTLGEYVIMENGENLDAMMSKTQLFSPTIEVDSAMSKVGVGSGVDYHANVKDGAYEECVFVGQTKWIDNDTGDILDEFATDKNLSLIDVKMPILRNVGKNLYGGEVITNKAIDFSIGELYDAEGYNALNYYTPVSQGSTITISNEYGKLESNTFILYNSNKEYTGFINVNGVATIPKGVRYVRAYGMSHIMMGSIQIEESSYATTYEPYKTNILRTSEEIVLREVNGVQNTYNALTGEYVQRIGERVYEQGDELNRLVKTDMTNTQYELSEPVITIVKPSTTPFAYANGHVILESGYDGRSLLPRLKYSVVASRIGQITQNAKTIMRHEERITSLEDLLLTQIVEMDYERVLLQFDYELQMMNLG